jgi:lipopolysaccharide transport system permease protein
VRPILFGPHRSVWAHLRELAGYRELIWNLVERELKGRYKSSALGFLWSLLNPLGMTLVFSVVFTVLMPSSIKNFPIFFLCGVLPWNYFSSALMVSINSIVANANLVKKVYFPREVLPISAVLANLVNFLLSLVVLFAALALFRIPLSPWLWLLPVVILVQTCFVLGMALLLATVNVFYRDTLMIMDVVMLAWFFLTPVVYSIDGLPRSLMAWGIPLDVRRLMYIVNPMASLIATYRDLLYSGYRTDLDFFLRSGITAIAILVIGYAVFVRFSHRFGEEI